MLIPVSYAAISVCKPRKHTECIEGRWREKDKIVRFQKCILARRS